MSFIDCIAIAIMNFIDWTATHMQIIYYVVSPLITLLAVCVAYMALARQSRPHILVHYRPNSEVQSIIDLVVENIGSGMARNVTFSKPLPVRCYGIERTSGKGDEVLGDGLPAIAAGQKYVFDGGQYGGLIEKLGEKLEVEVAYTYKNPFGFSRKRKELCVLSVRHLQKMVTRQSAEQAIVDALKGPNQTTLQRIENELRNISAAVNNLSVKFNESSDA